MNVYQDRGKLGSKLGPEEMKLVYYLDTAGTEMQISFLKRVIQEHSQRPYFKSSFYTAISALSKTGIIEIYPPLVSLAPQAISLIRYFYPFKKFLKGELILVSPQKASEETGFAVSTVRKQKAPFCYLSVGGRLYVIKNEPRDSIQRIFPLFPLIPKRDLKEYLRLPYYLYLQLKSVPYFMDDNREYFIWNLVFRYLLQIGKTNFKSYKKIGLEEVPYEILKLPKPSSA